MINPSESAGSTPTEEVKPNWNWLQDRLDATSTAQLDEWLSVELEELEESFAELITKKSRERSLKDDLSKDRDRS